MSRRSGSSSGSASRIPVYLCALAGLVLLLVYKSQSTADIDLGFARLEFGQKVTPERKNAEETSEETPEETSGAEGTSSVDGNDLAPPPPAFVEDPDEAHPEPLARSLSSPSPAKDSADAAVTDDNADATPADAGTAIPDELGYGGEPGSEEEKGKAERDHSVVHKAGDIAEPRDLLKEPPGCKSSGPVPVNFRKRKKGKRPCGGRVNFLFMVLDKILNPEIWAAFFKQAPEASYRVFVHCKSRECDEDMFKILPMIKRVSRKPTSRCLDLVTAEQQLMKQALKQYLSGADVLQKYVILTDSTLPVKPFSVVYDTLTRHRESDFCFFNDQWWPKTHLQYVKLSPTKVMLQRGGKKASLLVKHSQFVILNRADAETFSKNWKPVNRTQPVSFKVPLKSDRWTKGLRFVTPPEVPSFAFNHHRDTSIPFVGMCADEFALFSTLYGTFEKDEFGVDRCPLNYSQSCSKIEELIAQKRCYTMSIAGRGNPLVREMKADVNSSVHFGSGGHPCSFEALSTKSLQRLRYSEYMFARKFTLNASNTADYVKTVLLQ